MRCRSLSAPISIFSRLRVLCASVVKSPPPCPLHALRVPAASQRNAVPLPLSTHFHLLSSSCPLCLCGEISPSVSSHRPLGTGGMLNNFGAAPSQHPFPSSLVFVSSVPPW